jgi:hypothetical protein
MADAPAMKEYVVDIGGIPHTVLLTDEDAKRYGDRATPVKAKTPANKARKPANKSGGES